MKHLGLIKKALVGSIATLCIAGIAHAAQKECKTEQDRIKGCVESMGADGQESEYPYKNGKIHGLAVESYYACHMEVGGGEMGTLKTPYVNGKREGEAKVVVGGNLYATVKYVNDKVVSIKCTNGKVFSKNDLKNVHIDECGDFCLYTN